jgi:hypothetical protein
MKAVSESWFQWSVALDRGAVAQDNLAGIGSQDRAVLTEMMMTPTWFLRRLVTGVSSQLTYLCQLRTDSGFR